MGSRKLEDYIKPMLAKETIHPFSDSEWIFEIKWDGYRAVAETGSTVRLYSRNGNSFLQSYSPVVEALKKIRKKAVLDGEIVLLNEDGLPDFQKLQHYEENQHLPLVYYVFDILELDGEELYHLPLLERKSILQNLVAENTVIRYSDHIIGDGIKFFEAAVSKNLEGIMAKKADSNYIAGRRNTDWLKIKNNQTADVIIVGYTMPEGSRKYFGSLVLANKNDGMLIHAGNAGTGYDDKKLKEVFELLQPIKRSTSPLPSTVRIPGVTWVEPEYVCEVKFTEWTKDGKLRHPVFLHIREDKTKNEVDMKASLPVKNPVENKRTKSPSKKTASKRQASSSRETDDGKDILAFGKIQVNLTNRSKIYFPDDGITKGDVIEYYQSVADYILPYLKNRPQSLNRTPNGITSKGFYHKDAGDSAPSWVKSFKVNSGSADKVIDYIICNDKATLAYLNNLGCIELNPWHSVTTKPDNPDYLIIDLDPSDNNTFEQVIEAAQRFKKLLDNAGAESYCKTSGSTGLHIYVPMGRKYTYDQVKDFANILCMMIEEELPDFTTLTRNLKKRGDDRMYLDYLQNRKGQTIASVYSMRPKPGATVSMPLLWKEVKSGLTPQDFTIKNALKRIKKMGDIFSGVLGPGVNIQKCLKKLGQQALK